MGRILYWQYLLIGIFNRIIILNSNGLKIVILLQHPFQVRSLVEYLPCKLRVGYNLPVSVVLQGAGTDIQPLAHFLTCEEVLTAKERLVCLCTSLILLLIPLIADNTTYILSASMFKSLTCSIIFLLWFIFVSQTQNLLFVFTARLTPWKLLMR